MKDHYFSSSELFHFSCIAFEWNLRQQSQGKDNAKFVLTDEGMLPYSPYVAFPEYQVFTPDEMLTAFPKGADIVKRSMLNLSHMVKHPVAHIPWEIDKLSLALFSPPEIVRQAASDLEELGYISISADVIRVKPKGWEQIVKWQDVPTTSKQAFVAMWFAEEMKIFYRNAIKPAIERANFKCQRIDNVQHNNKICDEIIAEIRKSRFIVADFTGQRGGVYFEAGYGMGMGLPVIWLVRKDEVDKLHFDTRQYNHIVYETPEDLEAQLYNRIVATIH